MEYILLVFLVISTLLLAFFLFRKKISNTSVIETVFKVELQKEFLLNRDELSRNLKENRNEFTQNFERLNETLLKKAKDDREELRRTLKDFETSFSKSVESFNTTQKEKFDQ